MSEIRLHDLGVAEAEPERGWRLSLEMSEADAEDIAAGYVPDAVKAQLRSLLDWRAEDQRRADRPYRKAKTR